MSASREKKIRQGQSALDDPRTAREAELRKQEKRANILYGAIGIAFVIVAAIVIVVKSGVLETIVPAATINGEKYSAAEVNYYYVNTYNNFLSQYQDYLSYIGLDTSQSLKTQTCAFSDGQTWHEYFLDQALSTMAATHALADKAEAEGFVVEDMDEQLQQLEDQLNEYVEQINEVSSTTYTAESYLQAMYGKHMTLNIYKEQARLSAIASNFSSDYYTNVLTYTTADLKAEYEANKQDYDVVDYESLYVSGSVPTTDADGNAVEVTDEMTAAAMTEAKDKADKALAAYKAGETLEAQGNDELSYSGSDSASYSSVPAAAQEWLFDEGRKAGDAAVLEADSGYYVVVFNSRGRQDYNTVDVRHILITPENSELSEDDEGYEADVERLNAEAKAKAEQLLQSWQSGAATEDAFAQLANENSTDPGSNTNGGLYEQIYKGQMVTDFNDWCFDESRKAGDTGIVETSYGYHIMYFVGENVPYWQVEVEDTLRDRDYNAWYEEAIAGYEATTSKTGLQYVG